MKKYFLLIFVIYLGLNTVCKSYIYISSDKIPGKVIGIDRYSNKYKFRAKYSSEPSLAKEISKSPIVAFTYKNKDWEASQNKWGFINLLDMEETVTVLIREKDQNEVNINTLFQFWFTFHDMMTLLFVCIFGTAILESLFPVKRKTPKTWK